MMEIARTDIDTSIVYYRGFRLLRTKNKRWIIANKKNNESISENNFKSVSDAKYFVDYCLADLDRYEIAGSKPPRLFYKYH